MHILAIALGSAVAGSGGFLLNQKAKIINSAATRIRNFGNMRSSPQYASAIGASGAVMGVSAVATCLLPTMPISIFLIPISIPLWLVTAGYALFDGYYLDSQTSRTAHAGHLGGLAFGALYYAAYLRKSPMGVWHIAKGWMKRR